MATSHRRSSAPKGAGQAGLPLQGWMEEPSHLDELREQFPREPMSTAQPELWHCLLSSPGYSSDDAFLNFSLFPSAFSSPFPTLESG